MNIIDRLTANGAAQTYQTQSSGVSGTPPASTGKAHHGHRHHAAPTSDSVSFSDNAKSLAAARSAVQNVPDVREQRVAEIKQQVSDGTYNVPAHVLARKMLDQQQPQT